MPKLGTHRKLYYLLKEELSILNMQGINSRNYGPTICFDKTQQSGAITLQQTPITVLENTKNLSQMLKIRKGRKPSGSSDDQLI